MAPTVSDYVALGASHYQAGRLPEALAAYDSALHIEPGSAVHLLNRASVLGDLGRYDEALAALDRCEAQVITYPELAQHWRRVSWSVLARYGTWCGQTGQAQRSFDLLDRAAALSPQDLPTAMSRVSALTYLPDATPAQIRAEAEAFGRQVATLVGPPRTHSRTGETPQRLRIGLVSADLRGHPVARFLSPLGRLDPDRFELYAYSATAHPDQVTERLKQMMSVWRDIRHMPDAAVADTIAADDIHILVDLSGLSAGGRMALFAMRPAPVQVTWLGYVATTGLATMDYVLASEAVLPASDEWQWLETPWRLPETYLAFLPPEVAPAVNGPACIKNGFVTFGSFSNVRKLTPETLAAWADLLHSVPQSRLRLRSSSAVVAAESEAIVRSAFDAKGITPDRIDVAPAIRDYERHLASYGEIDIALDPQPFAGATTTCEALWMGVPVIARKGDRYASRMGENILQAVGRAHWIAGDWPDYVARASTLAGSPEQLLAERMSLRRDFSASPMGDIDRFASTLGDAFWSMWSTWSRGS